MKNEAKKKTITFKSKICDPFLAQVLRDRQASSHSPRHPQPLHILVREVYILVREVNILVREVRASLSSSIENVFSSKDDVGKLPQHSLNLEEEPGSKLLQVESLHWVTDKKGKWIPYIKVQNLQQKFLD